MPIIIDIDDENAKRLFSLWRDGVVSVLDKSVMWRFAVGAMKTGDIISRYRIPGAKVGCVFCGAALETARPLLLQCPRTLAFRKEIVESIEDLGAEVTKPLSVVEKSCLLALGLTPRKEGKSISRKVFSFVARCTSALWRARNEVMFSAGSYNAEALEAVDSCQRRSLLEDDIVNNAK